MCSVLRKEINVYELSMYCEVQQFPIISNHKIFVVIRDLGRGNRPCKVFIRHKNVSTGNALLVLFEMMC